MALNLRALPFEVPSYSLTGDVLSFQRCGLAYRYYNGSSLPPSRPVQMWTGEFVHGVLEEAYRHWSAHHTAFPWPCTRPPWPLPPVEAAQVANDIGSLGHRVEARLAASGKRSRSEAAREAAYGRVETTVNELCPHLFPIITAAEERISGTRAMPSLPAGEEARGTRYELTGVVDVISSVMLGQADPNPLVQLIQRQIPNVPAGEYDLIVDYKAGRRPALGSELREQFELQVQTYAWLRRQVPQSRPVGAGMLIYINELRPSRDDMVELRREIARASTDVIPASGSADYYAVHTWQPERPTPALSFDFRLRRAVHVVDVAPNLVQNAVGRIDSVIAQIESSAFREHNAGDIPNNWRACGAEEDCVACDFVHFCPAPAQLRARLQQPNPPPRPGPPAPG